MGYNSDLTDKQWSMIRANASNLVKHCYNLIDEFHVQDGQFSNMTIELRKRNKFAIMVTKYYI